MVSIAKLFSPQHMREQLFGRQLLPISSTARLRFRPGAHSRPVSLRGAASLLSLAVCPAAACSSTSGAKVPHAFASWAARPAAASVRFAPWQATAQASRSRGWRRHCLAFWPRPATVEPSLSSAKQTIRQAKGHEHPVQHAAEFLDFFWRPNRPLPNMLFKGTPTRCAACRPLTPALGGIN